MVRNNETFVDSYNTISLYSLHIMQNTHIFTCYFFYATEINIKYVLTYISLTLCAGVGGHILTFLCFLS